MEVEVDIQSSDQTESQMETKLHENSPQSTLIDQQNEQIPTHSDTTSPKSLQMSDSIESLSSDPSFLKSAQSLWNDKRGSRMSWARFSRGC